MTDRSRRVLAMAGEEANARGADAVEPQHLLLGLLRDQGLAQCALGNAAGLDYEKYSATLPHPNDQGGPQRELPFSEQSQSALDAAIEELSPLGHNYVGTEHLLLGLARESGGAESLDLASLGTSFSEIRAEVYGILGHDVPQ
ncbi:Clp protease N-terminal domain-containing protein [Posidoniimonas polymericola]|nr:Clp protease N-terminal domain-containing protein [Posidoniimonas polymericola]